MHSFKGGKRERENNSHKTKTLQHNCLEKATDISHEINTVRSCQLPPPHTSFVFQEIAGNENRAEPIKLLCILLHCGSWKPCISSKSDALFIAYACLCKLTKAEVYGKAVLVGEIMMGGSTLLKLYVNRDAILNLLLFYFLKKE